jgi:hypothetical protein
MSDILNDFAKKARDHARVPMQVRSFLVVIFLVLVLIVAPQRSH